MTAPDLGRLFAPASIAVIGASKRPGLPQTRLIRTLLSTSYPGQIFPVNGRYDSIEELRCYASVANLPATPDLAVIAIPAPSVSAALAECGEAGIRNAVVITAGFSELGAAGQRLQAELAEVAGAFGINLLGPNTMGFANVRDAVYATFSSSMGERQIAGPVAVASQSGGVAGVISELLERDAVGKSVIAAVGNEACVDLADVVRYAAARDDTTAICVYAENLRRAERLLDAIEAATGQGKNVIVLAGGLSAAGARAASSHTGALAQKPFVVRQLFTRAGALLADSPQQAASLAGATAYDRRAWSRPASQRQRRGRVGIIATSGGFGVLGADAADRQGLDLPSFTDQTLRKLGGLLPSYMSPGNPVDLPPEVITDPPLMREIAQVVAVDDNIDAVVVVGAMRAGAAGSATAAALAAGLAGTAAPAIAAWPSLNAGIRELFTAAGMGCAESADDVLQVAAHRLGSAGEQAVTPSPGAAAAGPAAAPARPATRLITEIALKRELAGLGIATPPGRVVTSAAAAAEAAALGFPLVAKGVSDQVAHKAAAGLVTLSIATAEDLATAYRTLSQRLARFGPGGEVLIERMVPPGPEIFAGLSRDPSLGDMLMLGAGGGDVEAGAGLQVARTSQLASGPKRAAFIRSALRSLPPAAEAAAGLEALVAVLLRFWNMRTDLLQLELNPVMWSAGSLTVVDALAVSA